MRTKNIKDMEPTIRMNDQLSDTLLSLRTKVSELAEQSEDEELLAEVVALFSGTKLPCAYTREEFKAVLQESEADYVQDQCVEHDQLFAKYGV